MPVRILIKVNVILKLGTISTPETGLEPVQTLLELIHHHHGKDNGYSNAREDSDQS